MTAHALAKFGSFRHRVSLSSNLTRPREQRVE